jgi:pimeloyl-ACP methyl ester carboxylesterase
VIAALPEHRCVALDLPGHGALRERPGPDQMSVSDYADVVRAELARRGLDGVCLIGHSLGGAIALRLAVDHPSLVSKLVLVGTGARLRVLPAVLAGARATPEQIWPEVVRAAFAPGHAAQAQAFHETQLTFAPGVLHRDLAACDRFDMMAELGRVSQPALIIVGEQDASTPVKYSAYLRDHLADAQLVIVPGTGHYVLVEAPEVVAGAMRAWLAGGPL